MNQPSGVKPEKVVHKYLQIANYHQSYDVKLVYINLTGHNEWNESYFQVTEQKRFQSVHHMQDAHIIVIPGAIDRGDPNTLTRGIENLLNLIQQFIN